MSSFAIEWDKDYGIDKRTGWTVKLDGAVLVQLERFLLVALWKSWRRKRLWVLP